MGFRVLRMSALVHSRSFAPLIPPKLRPGGFITEIGVFLATKWERGRGRVAGVLYRPVMRSLFAASVHAEQMPDRAEAEGGRREQDEAGEALTGERTENHYPNSCGICGATLELWHDNRGYSGHFVLDLERLPSGIRVACVLHRYHVVCCPCGKETV